MAEQKSFTEILYGKLDRAEMLFLLVMMAGVVFHFAGFTQSKTLIILSLGGLAVIFFLMAFRPPANRKPDGREKADLMNLIVTTILPKITWISCAVCASSLVMYHAGTGNDGYKQGLMIHVMVTVGGLLVLGFAALKGVKNLQPLFPMFFRAVPLLLAAVHLLQS